MSQNKRVAIIGAGPAGLVSAKEALTQNLIPTVFEKGYRIGGVWRTDIGNSWDTMATNTSKYYTVFSDFPWPKEAPLFPNADQVSEYLNKYADNFGLISHIRLNSEVVCANQLNSNEWLIKWTNNDGIEDEAIFDYLIVAAGLYTIPYSPTYDGESNFKGLIAHSKDYQKLKSTTSFAGKKVLVVGASFSACDISADLAIQNANIVNIFRRPYWNFTKVTPFDPNDLNKKLPVDFALFNRQNTYTLKMRSLKQGLSVKNQYYSQILIDQNKFPDLYIDPNSTESASYSISDNYMINIKNGKIRTKKCLIKSFNETGIDFEDGSHEDADVVLWCTGYRLPLNFLHESILDKIDYNLKNDSSKPFILYKNTFSPNITNMAFVGFIKEPLYSICEMQSRWVTSVFGGKVQMPSEEIMNEFMNNDKFDKPQNQSYSMYADQFADEIGVIPDLEFIKVNDPELYEMLWIGAPTAACYRLKDQPELALRVIKEAYQVRKELLGN